MYVVSIIMFRIAMMYNRNKCYTKTLINTDIFLKTQTEYSVHFEALFTICFWTKSFIFMYTHLHIKDLLKIKKARKNET